MDPGDVASRRDDAARPAVTAADVARVIEAARRDGAAILATRVRDTIKRVREGRVVETPSRAECWAAQTPQVFRAEILWEALAKISCPTLLVRGAASDVLAPETADRMVDEVLPVESVSRTG